MATVDPMTQYADKIIVDGWCLRSGLVRYAQAEPKRSTMVHAFMRRLDAALSIADDRRKVELSPVVGRFETLASAVSQWAAQRHANPIPNALVDELLHDTTLAFELLNVPEESADPAERRGMRSSEGRRPPKAKPSSSSESNHG